MSIDFSDFNPILTRLFLISFDIKKGQYFQDPAFWKLYSLNNNYFSFKLFKSLSASSLPDLSASVAIKTISAPTIDF